MRRGFARDAQHRVLCNGGLDELSAHDACQCLETAGRGLVRGDRCRELRSVDDVGIGLHGAAGRAGVVETIERQIALAAAHARVSSAALIRRRDAARQECDRGPVTAGVAAEQRLQHLQRLQGAASLVARTGRREGREALQDVAEVCSLVAERDPGPVLSKAEERDAVAAAEAHDEVPQRLVRDGLLSSGYRFFVDDDEHVASHRRRSRVGCERRWDRKRCDRSGSLRAEELKEADGALASTDFESDLLRRQIENRLPVLADRNEVDHRLC